MADTDTYEVLAVKNGTHGERMRADNFMSPGPRMAAPGGGPVVDDHSTPMPIRQEGNVVTAEATIGISTLGSLGVAPLFR